MSRSFERILFYFIYSSANRYITWFWRGNFPLEINMGQHFQTHPPTFPMSGFVFFLAWHKCVTSAAADGALPYCLSLPAHDVRQMCVYLTCTEWVLPGAAKMEQQKITRETVSLVFMCVVDGRFVVPRSRLVSSKLYTMFFLNACSRATRGRNWAGSAWQNN